MSITKPKTSSILHRDKILQGVLDGIESRQSESLTYAIDYLPTGFVKDATVDYREYIQTAIDESSARGNILVMPNFPVLIGVVDQFTKPGLMVRDNSTIYCPDGSEFRIKPNNFEQYGVFTLTGVKNVRIYNPVCIGDKYTHLGTLGEFGFGIFIRGSCDSIYIENAVCKDMWGDGIFIGPNWPDLVSYPNCVHIVNPHCDNNRRQGISLTAGSHITIDNPLLTNTKSSDATTPLPNGPHAGIDIEPDYWHTPLDNVTINNLRGYGNDASLFYVALKLANANKPSSGGAYKCSIVVNGINDYGSFGAVALWGLPSDGDFYGHVVINDVVSVGAKGNPVLIHDWFYNCKLPVSINNITIADWDNGAKLTDMDKACIRLSCSESNTYPTSASAPLGSFNIDNVSISYSKPNMTTNYAVYSTPHNGYWNSSINFRYVKTTSPMKTNIFGNISMSNGLFGYTLLEAVSDNITLNPPEFQDRKVLSTSVVTLPSFDDRFYGKSYRFLADGSSVIRFKVGSQPVVINGTVANNFAIVTASAGVTTVTPRSGFVFIQTEGNFSVE